MAIAKKKEASPGQVECGAFSKEEAANKVAAGVRHLHAHPHADKDPQAQLTIEAIKNQTSTVYPWEKAQEASVTEISTASDRHVKSKEMIQAMGLSSDRKLNEGTMAVLEELITNAIYHSYRTQSGERKYNRSENAHLPKGEEIRVSYNVNSDGVYLRVEDSGGTLTFEDIRESIDRCYRKDDDQVLNNETGGGLGLYISFDRATHIKVEVFKNKKTIVSCWIAGKRTFNQDVFSFNYFEQE